MCQSANEQEGEEKHNDGNNTLTKEIDSWSNFEYALREENRLLFNKMLSECKENEGYLSAADSKMNSSQLNHCLWLILQQQKMINELIAKVLEQKGKEA
jgi:hypothetical protein